MKLGNVSSQDVKENIRDVVSNPLFEFIEVMVERDLWVDVRISRLQVQDKTIQPMIIHFLIK